MRRLAFGAMSAVLVVMAVLLCSQCRAIRVDSTDEPVSHAQWDALLKRHVDADGWVDYGGFVRDSAALNAYLRLLSSSHPSDAGWTREEQMAYWINAYNAFTVKLVADHYPVAGIKEIRPGLPFVNTVWDIKFINIQGRVYDLNNIEHNILRPVFKDARIHAAVNCASYSCPKLRGEAYEADRLDEQLDDAMRNFIRDPLRNRIAADGSSAALSELFKWFSGDFNEASGSVRAFINRYAEVPLQESAGITYIDYDWRLNERP